LLVTNFALSWEWSADHTKVALHLMQYANPMAINTWAIARKYPRIKQAGRSAKG
jgi:alpha-galactosidase/6-phospho-beta-glucosidase family protein